MSDEKPAQTTVSGERDTTLGVRVLSAQSRVSNALAIALMSVLGLGSLTWYYANAVMRQGRAKATATATAAKRAQGDLPLPPLGRIDPPMAPLPAPPPGLFEPTMPPEPPQDSPLAAGRTLTEIPLAQNSGPPNGAPPPKTPAQLALERELSGAVFASRSAMSTPGAANGDDSPVGLGSGAAQGGGPVQSGGELTTLLKASATPAVRARVLPAQRLLLAKGAFLDCTLETAIDSTLPGMTTCIMATDTFGVDGKVVLLERGTKLIGETRGQVQQGAARVFVVWTEARTPSGVIVPLDSPGADELGRSGLPGEINRHFWQRFGAAMLVSVVEGTVQAATQSARGGSGTIVLNPSGSEGVLTEILKNTINIAPTVVKHQGDRIQVLVARDLDFRSVYELRSATAR